MGAGAFGDGEMASSGAKAVATVHASSEGRHGVAHCGLVDPSIGDVLIDDVVALQEFRLASACTEGDFGHTGACGGRSW